ncbi:MAG TPA: hypothetical protein VFE91_01525 [Nitrososphaerales archaeon]|nr:hypothetical protein [Nitrososphaerales archaeon]
MPLKNRRGEYSWPSTSVDQVTLVTDKKTYSPDDEIIANVGFRIVGGLREAFHPDVWTTSWEDFDKIVRLTMGTSVRTKSGPRSKKVKEIKKEVRRASFYWSRDPDLPYRIWAMVIPEDGGPPKIPRNVEDAKSKMLDVEKTLRIPAGSLGHGRKKLVAEVYARWGRRSFIEKGQVKGSSRPVEIDIGN